MAITLFSADEIPVVGEPEDAYSSHAQAFAYGVQRLASEINAEAALENAATTTTSASSNSLTAGDKTFTVAAGLGWASGIAGIAAVTGSSTQYAPFVCKSYSGSTLIVTFGTPVGSGTFTTWTITKASGVANVATLSGNTFTGTQNLAEGASVASTTTVNLTALTDGNTRALTGVATINAWTLANGAKHDLVYTGAGLTLTYSSTTNRLNSGGANVSLATNDRLRVFSQGGVVNVIVTKDSGRALVSNSELKAPTAVANTPANGVTITYPAGSLEFRSTTLNSGTPVLRTNSSADTLVLPANATLGAVSNVASRIVILAVDNGAGFSLALGNLAGGLNLDETGLITTVAISGTSNSATTIYSTSALTSRPYRIVGFYDETQTVAGTHSAALTLVQGSGGNAMTAMSSLGYGQTWQTFTVGTQRVLATTYYNTTGKPILVKISQASASGTQLIVDGVNTGISGGLATSNTVNMVIVPAGSSYSVTGAASTWAELR